LKIKITADSTCDLSPELVEKYNVGIIPLYIVKGDRSYKDGIEITPQEIFAYVDSGKGVCNTAAVNIIDYESIFVKYLEEYDAVIHIDISSDMSSCYQNACIAAQPLHNVYVVDSRNLSTGIGHLVIDAANMAEAGMAPADIKAALDKLTAKVESSFVIDTLKYLHKGGRCSSIAALGANLLKLRPCIEVVDGKMIVGKKYRGSMEKELLHYVEDRLGGRTDIDTRRIFITFVHPISDELLEAIKEKIKGCQKFDEVLTTIAGCTISNHCGGSTLGILFYRK